MISKIENSRQDPIRKIKDLLELNKYIKIWDKYLVSVNSFQAQKRDELLNKDMSTWTTKEERTFKKINQQIEGGVWLIRDLRGRLSALINYYTRLSDAYIEIKAENKRLHQLIKDRDNAEHYKRMSENWEGMYYALLSKIQKQQ